MKGDSQLLPILPYSLDQIHENMIELKSITKAWRGEDDVLVEVLNSAIKSPGNEEQAANGIIRMR